MAVDTKKKQTQILTPEFRVSFPAVFEARSAAEGQPAKYSVTMLFPKTVDLSLLKNAVKEAAIAKWGPDSMKWPTKKNDEGKVVSAIRLPIRDGASKDYDGYEGMVFAIATSKMKPGLVDANVQPIITPSEFYGGCYARATIAAFAYDVNGNKGVSFGLRNIQKLRDGEPFSGKTKPEEDFDAITPPAGAGVGAGVGDDTNLFA